MRIFGLNFPRLKEVTTRLRQAVGTWSRVFDYITGAWQASSTASTLPDNPLLSSTVFACMRLIAQDISKLAIDIRRKEGSIWKVVSNSPYYKSLNSPNWWQTRVQFYFQWVLSLLHYGNTYVLIGERDARGIITKMTVLDPRYIQVLVSQETGDIFYRVSMQPQPLAGIFETEQVYIPAEWIIHQRYMPLEHPLCGTSPLRVACLSANTSRKVLAAHNDLFTNGVVPPGVLYLQEGATQEQVDRIGEQWAQFRATGRTAVLEASTKFESIAAKSIDSQALELLKFSVTDICVAFGVRPWKIGAEPVPAGTNAETGNLMYYSDTLQYIIEDMEALLDRANNMPNDVWATFDIDGLYRMDTAARYTAATNGVKGNWMTIDEARAKADNLEPVEGGNTIYMQQQYFSLSALNKRDTQPQALGAPGALPPAGAPPEGTEDPTEGEQADAKEEKTAGPQDKALQAALGASYKGVWHVRCTPVAGDVYKRSGKLWEALVDTDQTPSKTASDWHCKGDLK